MGKEPREGEQVTIRYRDVGDAHIALGILIRSAASSTYTQSSPGEGRHPSGQVKPADDPDEIQGIRQMDAKQYREAVTSFDRSTARLPQMPYAYLNRGECHMQLEQFDRAIQDFTAAIDRYPNLQEQPSTLALELGIAYEERGKAYLYLHQDERGLSDYDQASSYLERAVPGPVTDLHYQSLHAGRCSALHNLNRDQLAIDDCTKALTPKPQDAYRYLNRGVVFFRVGREDLARADFARAADKDPSLRQEVPGLEASLKAGKPMHLDP